VGEGEEGGGKGRGVRVGGGRIMEHIGMAD